MQNLISRLEKLKDEETKEIARPVIQRNGFFAHPENILLAMIHDESEVVRMLGWKRILKARKSAECSSRNVRAFQIPKINFESSKYYDLVNWADLNLTEPPVVRNIPTSEMKENAR